MTITYRVESLNTCLREIKYMFEAHQVEVNGAEPLDPDYAQYALLEGLGLYTMVVARNDGDAVGYLGYAMVPSLHLRGERNAIVDVLYLKPHWRRGGNARGMIWAAIDAARSGGASALMVHMPVSNPFRPLLTRVGFELIEENWRLDI